MSQAGNARDIEIAVVPRSSDIGGFEVQRALPTAKKRIVGPFVFLDQMGPAVLGANNALDVAPHPHIGLATVTYLLDGEILHRDSLGSVQTILPGAVNWMTAGSGIVHSERTPPGKRNIDHKVFGIQTWVALPQAQEETAPAFVHHAADELPVVSGEGINARLVIGSLFGETAPVKTFQEMFYADVSLDANASLQLAAEHEERAAYLVAGNIEIGNMSFSAPQLIVFKPGSVVTLRATSSARLTLLGGEAMDGPRFIWWNFVSSSRERIEQAKDDWRNNRFASVPGEKERIPLPGEQWPEVDYP